LTYHAACKVEFQPPIGGTHSWRFFSIFNKNQIWRSPPQMMLPLSRSWPPLAEALTRSFLNDMWQGGASTKPPWRLARRDLIDKWEQGSFSSRTLFSLAALGVCIPWSQPLWRPSVMADLVGWTWAAGRWLTSLHGWHVWPETDGIYVSYPPHKTIYLPGIRYV